MIDAYFATDNVLLKTIGEKVRSKRIAMRYTQEQVATASGTSLSSVKNLENGANISMMTLIQILRALQAFDLLEPFFREEGISPIAYAEALRKSQPSKRVRKKNELPTKIESEW